MLKLEFKMFKIFKVLLMLNGKLFMKSYKKCMMLELISFFQNYLLVILQLNGLLIEEFSVQVESPIKILLESQKLLVLLFKLQSTISNLMCWELVVNSKKNKLELKDITYLKIVQILNQPLLF